MSVSDPNYWLTLICVLSLVVGGVLPISDTGSHAETYRPPPGDGKSGRGTQSGQYIKSLKKVGPADGGTLAGIVFYQK